jgi:polyisoprenoid-binding protein YceI
MSSPTITTLETLTGSWILDPNRTMIRFQTKIMRVIKVNGTFKALEGQASLAVNGALDGSVIIDSASIDTKIAKRDTHLRGPDFFKVEKYPKITFTATNGHLTSAGQVELIGNLEIHGQTRTLTLGADVSNTEASLKFSSDVDIDRRDWGISWTRGPSKESSMKIHVDIAAYFDRA